MCDLCGSYPCVHNCPNSHGPIDVFRCCMCGEYVTSGEWYVKLNGKRYHEECIEQLGTTDLVELVGGEFAEARDDDSEIDDGSDLEYEIKRDLEARVNEC